MGKNILARETGEVEPDPIRQEAKAGLRQLFAAFAGEHDIEALFERMEMDDIGGRVGNLCFAQFWRAPIGGLLLLGQLSSRFRLGASAPRGGICTTSAEPSPGDSCTTHNRSRVTSSPMVSVSIATAPL